MTPIKRFWLYWKFYNELKQTEIDDICRPHLLAAKIRDLGVQMRFKNSFNARYRDIYAKNKLKELDNL
jgi:hypothetical protein